MLKKQYRNESAIVEDKHNPNIHFINKLQGKK